MGKDEPQARHAPSWGFTGLLQVGHGIVSSLCGICFVLSSRSSGAWCDESRQRVYFEKMYGGSRRPEEASSQGKYPRPPTPGPSHQNPSPDHATRQSPSLNPKGSLPFAVARILLRGFGFC